LLRSDVRDLDVVIYTYMYHLEIVHVKIVRG
jgi:hypothetical protein